MQIRLFLLIIISFYICSCQNESKVGTENTTVNTQEKTTPAQLKIDLDLAQANRLALLPLACIQTPLPYKAGLVIEKESDLQMPQVHHPAFYGCFDWHSAVHGHWSLAYLMKTFKDLEGRDQARKMLHENLTKENIEKEVAYFSLNSNTKSFERTYGWAWVLKLQEELYTWDDEDAKLWYNNLKPLADYISDAYQSYLPKLVYPIRVGEHSNTGFGLSFAYDYAQTVGDNKLKEIIETSAKRFYLNDLDCPIHYEPSGYDFLSPCLQEMDIMRKVLSEDDFTHWANAFLPGLFDQTLKLEPGRINDRSDGKLVHLDGLNFSRAWCLYSVKSSPFVKTIADEHLKFSLDNITDDDYAGQHWLASFALYAFKAKSQ